MVSTIFNNEHYRSEYGGLYDPMVVGRIETIIHNATLGLRSGFLDRLVDPRRDVDNECGYPKGNDRNSITIEMYEDMYDREAIPARVVEVLPKECWNLLPEVRETEDNEERTEFEQAVLDLCSTNRGEQSYYKDEKGVGLLRHLMEVDVKSGIGHYGTILIGLDDLTPGQDLSNPASMRPLVKEKSKSPATPKGKGSGIPYAGPNGSNLNNEEPPDPTQPSSSNANDIKRNLLYLRVFTEGEMRISRVDNNPASSRFGLPETYTVQYVTNESPGVVGPESGPAGDRPGVRAQEVHWTRVVHVVDNDGIPRMKQVFNRLLDLRKLYGGSAEMYWKGAFPGISFETHPQLGGDVQVNKATMRRQLEQYFNGLQRFLILTGMMARSIAPQVVSPKDQIDIQLEAICIKLGIPIRIFKGSERGELASSQDEGSWDDILMGRRTLHINPNILRPVIDRLINLYVLPVPTDGYYCEWPLPDTTTEADRADTALKLTQALAAYVSGGIENTMTFVDYLVEVWGWDPARAESVAANVQEELDRKAQEEEELRMEMEAQLATMQPPNQSGQPGQSPVPGQPGKPQIPGQPGTPPPLRPPPAPKLPAEFRGGG